MSKVQTKDRTYPMEAEASPEGATLQSVVEAFLASQPPDDPAFTHAPFNLGDVEAEWLEYAPGQLFSRVVLALLQALTGSFG